VECTVRRVILSLRPARRSREQGRKRAGVGGGLGGVGARVEEARRLEQREQRVASATGVVAACSNVSVVLEHSRWQQKVARGCIRLRRDDSKTTTFPESSSRFLRLCMHE
jgi:hypothetical protein